MIMFRSWGQIPTILFGLVFLLVMAGCGSTSTQAPANLEGVEWVATKYWDGTAVVNVMRDIRITVNLNSDGSLNGSGGCNQYNGTFKTEEDQISISPIVTTRMACNEPEGIMEQETAYLAAFQSTVSYEISGLNLEMNSIEGHLTAVYTTNQ